MARVARVAVENAALSFDKIYTYLIPDGMDARPGCRVTAPFGAGNRTRFGIVMETADGPAPQRAKTLASLVDEKPLLDAEMLALARWLRETTFCTYFDAVRALLPPGAGVRLQYQYLLPRGAVLPGGADGDRRRVFEYLKGRGRPVREETLCAALALAPDAPVLRDLCEEGLLIKSQLVRQRVLDGKLVMVRLANGIETLSDVTVKIRSEEHTSELQSPR